jgi:hypothetical protein
VAEVNEVPDVQSQAVTIRQQKPVMAAGGLMQSVMPRSFEEVQRLASTAVAAGLYGQQSAKEKKQRESGTGYDYVLDEKKAVAQATMAILMGLEIGSPPMQSLQNITVINGRCMIWGDLVPALVRGNGHKMREWIDGDGDNMVAHCEITRGDTGEVIPGEFSVEDAKRARLWQTEAKVKKYHDKPPMDNDSPWYRFPKRMLQMRARGFAARDGIADIMKGMQVREEHIDLDRDEYHDVTPGKVNPFNGRSLPDVPDVGATAIGTSARVVVPDVSAEPTPEAKAIQALAKAASIDALDEAIASLDEAVARLPLVLKTYDARKAALADGIPQ